MEPLLNIKLTVYPNPDSVPTKKMELECTCGDLIRTISEKVNRESDKIFDRLFYRDDEGEIVSLLSPYDLLKYGWREPEKKGNVEKKKVYLVVDPDPDYLSVVRDHDTKTVIEGVTGVDLPIIDIKLYVRLRRKMFKIVRFEYQLPCNSREVDIELRNKNLNAFKIDIARQLKIDPKLLSGHHFLTRSHVNELSDPYDLVEFIVERVKRIFVDFKPDRLKSQKTYGAVLPYFKMPNGKGVEFLLGSKVGMEPVKTWGAFKERVKKTKDPRRTAAQACSQKLGKKLGNGLTVAGSIFLSIKNDRSISDENGYTLFFLQLHCEVDTTDYKTVYKNQQRALTFVKALDLLAEIKDPKPDYLLHGNASDRIDPRFASIMQKALQKNRSQLITLFGEENLPKEEKADINDK